MDNNPSATLRNIAAGHFLARSLHVIADLGVADALTEESCTATDLAEKVGAHPDALRRVLRLLAAHDIFAVQGDMVKHTPTSQLLRADHPLSMRPLVQMFGRSSTWRTYEHMDHSLRTDEPASTQTIPEGFWAYMAEHPEDGQIFNAAMEARAREAGAGILAIYDFSRFQSIADIGGGRGHLLRAILKAVPTTTGVLFDLPHVTEEIKDLAHDRLMVQAGDFFTDALPTCDAYLLMEVIHDWGDAEALAILQAVRRATPTGATLLLIEKLISDGDGPDWVKVLDIHMLTMLGGRQRSQAEYVELLNQAGFQFVRQIDTGTEFAILEAEKNTE